MSSLASVGASASLTMATAAAASALAAGNGLVLERSCGGFGQGKGEDLHGIQPDTLPAHSEMQVRTRDAARGTGKADAVGLLEFVAFLYVGAREVQVDREEALSVINDDGVAFVEQVAGENDRAGVRGERRVCLPLPESPFRCGGCSFLRS